MTSWKKETIIYEIFVRVFSTGGNFSGIREKISYLKELGINLVWLMPIYPISSTNRKGLLGSPYALSGHTEIHPDLGNKEEFQQLVKELHKNDIRLIIDWETNYTGWDHPWLKEHPEWYQKDENGKIISPHRQWWDVARLNFQNENLVAEMLDCMKYWIENFGVDGFRCDMAGDMLGRNAADYWQYVAEELRRLNPDLFLLAEWEDPKLHPSFDLTYDWKLFHTYQDVYNGQKSPKEILNNYFAQLKEFSPHTRLRFLENHDERRAREYFGPKFSRLFSALIFSLPGVPLIYNGQEWGESERPSHFDYWKINWERRDEELLKFYQQLIKIRRENSCLTEGELLSLDKHLPENFLGFLRQENPETIIYLANFSSRTETINLSNILTKNYLTNLLTGEKLLSQKISLAAEDFLLARLW